MGNRHKAREFALQMLYAIDVSESAPDLVVPLFWETLTCPDEVRRFANELVNGVDHNLDRIDEIIARYSEHWAIDRMTSVDRNILRMAVFELLHLTEIPHSVTINEAVEIGKKFGSEDSGAFVNGILDKIAREIRNGGGVANGHANGEADPGATKPNGGFRARFARGRRASASEGAPGANGGAADPPPVRAAANESAARASAALASPYLESEDDTRRRRERAGISRTTIRRRPAQGAAGDEAP